MPETLTRNEYEAALRRASASGAVADLVRGGDHAQIAAAVAQAAPPREGVDQKGRVWSRWTTLIPGHFRLCKKCGAKIATGYLLEPHVTTAICAKHVHQRWI